MAFIEELPHESPEIISLATARKQLQMESDFTEDDALISTYIDAAINEAEHFINSEISEKKFKVQGKSFSDAMAFNKHILQSVESIKYTPVIGAEETIAAENYSIVNVDKYENQIEFAENFEYPAIKPYTPTAVKIEFTVGYPAGKVPKAIQKALLLMISQSYEFRTDTIKEKSTAAENTLQKFRRY
jgi:uncharacterized phiE125 gp8 family phage protein